MKPTVISKRARTVLIVTLAVAALGGGAAYYAFGMAGSAEDALPRTATAKIGTIQSSVPAEGRIEVASWELTFSTPGVVESVSVEPGDLVVAGQVLATLDSEKADAQVAQYQASLAGAIAKRDGVLASPTAADIAVKRATVDAATVAVDSAEDALDLLRESGGASALEIQAKEAALANARAGLRTAEANLDATLAGASSADIRSAEAAVDQAAAAARGAQITAGEYVLIAPASGTVVEVNVTAGTLSSANGAPAIVVADLERPYVVATIDENDYSRAAVDMPVDILVDAAGGTVLTGAVTHLAPVGTVDQNGIVTFALRTSIDVAGSGVAPGMTVRLDVITKRAKDVITIPNEAVTMIEGKQVVALIQADGSTVETKVSLGITDGSVVEVLAGLKVGDRLLIASAGS